MYTTYIKCAKQLAFGDRQGLQHHIQVLGLALDLSISLMAGIRNGKQYKPTQRHIDNYYSNALNSSSNCFIRLLKRNLHWAEENLSESHLNHQFHRNCQSKIQDKNC
ncbi:hypothetical protein CI610_02521 [invertebrate metagenome]|uniref:Uncharacterized protein n=1 Tax=invertebrate metagenome TaxID=1711999 RepID=A0A2H9T5R2_9ZZZZ